MPISWAPWLLRTLNGKFRIDSDSGRLEWGTGGTAAPDARISYGGASGTVQLTDSGGSTGGKLNLDQVNYTGNTAVNLRWGSSAPESSVTASVGSLYGYTSGSSGTTFYVKESGTGNTGWRALVSSLTAPFGATGNLVVIAGTQRFYVDKSWTITQVRASVNTASAGQSIIIDVNKNGTTIWSTQSNRVTISAGSNTATQTTFNTTSLASGDYLTVDIDQVGTTTAGADLTVQITLA